MPNVPPERVRAIAGAAPISIADGSAERASKAVAPVNDPGLPALPAPAGRSPLGFLIELQLIHRPFGDGNLVAPGSAFQAAKDHHLAVAPLP